jgi:hypothetical protein
VGSVVIDDNLLVGYAHAHTDRFEDVSDGISNHHPRSTITRNGLVDTTDVALIFFGHDGMTQASEASGNTIVQAGNSVNAAFMTDTMERCNGCAFAGPGIHDNLLLAARSQHVDILAVLGSGPWVPDASPDHVTCPSGPSCGHGASITNNRTLWNDPRQQVLAQVAMVVDGMLDASDANQFDFEASPSIGGGRCDHGTATANHAGHSSGHLFAGSTAATHGCLPHP